MNGTTDTIENSFKLIQMKIDLFSSPDDISLAHCISQDLRMGKEKSERYKELFGSPDHLQGQGKQVGQIAILSLEKRFVYHMITKQTFWEKPTYEALNQCLLEVKSHAVKNQVKQINMPKVGCGLDRLNWIIVRRIIERIFGDTDIHIIICTL